MKIFKAMVFIIILFIFSTRAFAGLYITDLAYTPTTFNLTFGWDPETTYLGGWTTSGYWEWIIVPTEVASGTKWMMSAYIQHLNDPHTSENTDAGDMMNMYGLFNKVGAYGNVVDGSDMSDHGTSGHYDTATFTFYRDETSSLSTGSLTAIHVTPVVPEPISSTLFIVGGVALGFRRFRKNTKVQ